VSSQIKRKITLSHMKCPKCKKKMEVRSQGMTDYEWYHDYFCDTCNVVRVKSIKLTKKKEHTNA
jgi:predicted RNA-binding Zn-ribbon protein involved in translation (DUF1610 family)